MSRRAVRSKYANRDLVFSAELVREFRNFIVHGEDKVPDHEAWHYGRTRGEATARVRRFYAIGRLILVLIQSFACAGLCGEGKEIEYGEDDTGLGACAATRNFCLPVCISWMDDLRGQAAAVLPASSVAPSPALSGRFRVGLEHDFRPPLLPLVLPFAF